MLKNITHNKSIPLFDHPWEFINALLQMEGEMGKE